MTEPSPPFDYLSLEDVLEIAAGVIDAPVVRDLGLLQSAVIRPRMTVFGADAYPTFAEKAAALMQSIARNHALIDGNKRLAWAATRVFCLLNDTDLAYHVDDAEQLVLAVAQGSIDLAGIAPGLREHLT